MIENTLKTTNESIPDSNERQCILEIQKRIALIDAETEEINDKISKFNNTETKKPESNKKNKNKEDNQTLSKKTKDQQSGFLEKAKFLTRTRSIRLAASVFAFLGTTLTSSSLNSTVDNNKNLQNIKNIENLKKEKTEVENILKGVDLETFNSFKTDSAKLRYLTIVAQEEKNESDFLVNENQKIKDAIRLTVKKFESGFSYTEKNPNSTASGAFQVLSSHLKLIGLDPDSKEDRDIFLTRPDLQEKLFDVLYENIFESYKNKKGELNASKFFEVYYIGHTGVYGSKNENLIPESNTESVKQVVDKRLRHFNFLLGGMRGKGQWIFDNTKDSISWKGKEISGGKLYWINSRHKKTLEIQTPAVVSGDKNESYIEPVSSVEDLRFAGKALEYLEKNKKN